MALRTPSFIFMSKSCHPWRLPKCPKSYCFSLHCCHSATIISTLDNCRRTLPASTLGAHIPFSQQPVGPFIKASDHVITLSKILEQLLVLLRSLETSFQCLQAVRPGVSPNPNSFHVATLASPRNACVLPQKALPTHSSTAHSLASHRPLLLSPSTSAHLFPGHLFYPPPRASFRFAGTSPTWCCWAVWSILTRMWRDLQKRHSLLGAPGRPGTPATHVQGQEACRRNSGSNVLEVETSGSTCLCSGPPGW